MLNGPQFKFAAGVAAGLSFVDAYTEAYPEANPGSARRAASRLASNVDIQREVERIRQSAEGIGGQAVLTLVEKRMFLARVVRAVISELPDTSDLLLELPDGSRGLPDKLLAIALDNELAGHGSRSFAHKSPTATNARRSELAVIARDPAVPASERIAANAEDNALAGHGGSFAPA